MRRDPGTGRRLGGALARSLLLVGLWGAGIVPGHAAPAPQIRIVQPVAGATVNAASVEIRLTVDGVSLAPTAAQWPAAGVFHLALDGVDVLQTRELRFALMGVPPGAHRLRVTLEGYPGGPVAPADVAITAVAVAPPAGATWLLAGTVAGVAGVMLVVLVGLWLVWVRPQQVEALYDAAAGPDEDESARSPETPAGRPGGN
ncbi:MAG TPA: hypothetical protein VKY74_12390 [Chloroflexia bacterium]|nr:hypothetical protein [Chloroflexia bacterium]